MIGKSAAGKKTAVVGTGNVFLKYKEGLISTKQLDVVAVMNIDSKAIGFNLFDNVNKYTSLKEMFENENLDVIIVSTPPKSHYEIVNEVLNNGVNVIVEKPMALELSQIQELYDLARKKSLFINTSYHWQNGQEVIEFNKRYDPKKIISIKIEVNDPYSEDSYNIDPDKIALEGCWIDSGVNSLSLIKTWLDFTKYEIIDVNVIFARNIVLPIYSDVVLTIDDIECEIIIDWSQKKNYKKTSILYDDREIIIDHTLQKIIDGGMILSYDEKPRLQQHYYNYFKNLTFESNSDETYKIHEILLDVLKKYK